MIDAYCPLCASKGSLLRDEDGFLTFKCLTCEFEFSQDEGVAEVDCCICGTHHRWDGSYGVDPAGWAVVYDCENAVLSALCPICSI